MTYQPAMANGNRWDGLRLHPFLFDVLTKGLTQVASLAASFILVGAVSKCMGVVALGEYLLIRLAACLRQRRRSRKLTSLTKTATIAT